MFVTKGLLESTLNILQSIQASLRVRVDGVDTHYAPAIPCVYIDDLAKQIKGYLNPERRSPRGPSEIKKRIASWQYVSQAIIEGLEGKPFSWCGGEFDAYRPKAEAMGLSLVTKTQIARMGYRLKQGAKPVGSGYFRAPISRSANLYVLECQCVKDETAAGDG